MSLSSEIKLLLQRTAQQATLLDTQADAEYAEEHAHHLVRWFTKRNPQTATQWCVTLTDNLGLAPYRAISGNGVYGADPGDEAQLFGTADIPIAGMVRGDFDEMLVTANSSNTIYMGRLVWGTGTLAASVGLGQFTEFVFLRPSADQNRKVFLVHCPKIPITIGGLPTQIWVQCQNATDNATMDFVIGVHGYDF